MNKNLLRFGASIAVLCSTASFTSAFAQDAKEPAKENSETIIVTGVVRAANKLDTSISVSALDIKSLQNSAPRGTTEALKSIPGVRAEASAGGGNSNIGVRGIPVSTGGQKWVQAQEDGLPIQLFGDSNFNAPDAYYKVDSNLARIEAVRGGTASTMTTNGPGAIINFISQTGKNDGGSISFEKGVSYNNNRIDGGFGGHLSDDIYYYIGGHYESGGDTRDMDYNGTEGGQIRASLTKEFGGKNFMRVWVKGLDKKEATFMPQATWVDGCSVATLSSTTPVGGCGKYGDPVTRQANNSPYLNKFISVIDGVPVQRDGADGIHVKSLSFGGEFNAEAGNGWIVNDKFKVAKISGDFIAPFTDVVLDASQIASRYGAGVTATYFNGPHAGQAVNAANLKANNGNDLLQEIAMFDTQIKDAGNFANDLKVSNSFDLGTYKVDLTMGYFHMSQNFVEAWHWQQMLADVGDNTSLISLSNGATQGGQLGYNKGFNWGGNARNYDFKHTADAPYVAATIKADKLTIDASVRRDSINQQGVQTEAATKNIDVNGDGIISLAETGISVNSGINASTTNINFKVDHTAYSLGVNYKIQPDMAVFGRYSNGASFNSERQYGNSAATNPSGNLTAKGREFFVDVVKQYEIGLKWQTTKVLPGKLNLATTYFHADTEESQTNTTSIPPVPYNITYTSKGLETEIIWKYNDLTLNGSVTYTDAVINSNTLVPTNVGHRPRRQAPWIYSLSADYKMGKFDLGANIYGTADSYGDFQNWFKMDGFATVGAYVTYHMSDKLTLSLNANNLFDTVGFTEGETDNGRYFKVDGSTNYNMTSARPIAGRTISARLKYNF